MKQVTAKDLLKISELIGIMPVENPFAHLPESRLREALDVIENHEKNLFSSGHNEIDLGQD